MPTILICDDEKDIVSALEIYLRSEGYDTVAAYNGHDAVERLHEQETRQGDGSFVWNEKGDCLF